MIDENSILIDATEDYSVYYNIETKILSISDGLEVYGVGIDKLGSNLFKKGHSKNDK